MPLLGNGLVYVLILSIFFILKIYTDLYKKIITIFMTFVVYKHNANNILWITKHYVQMYNDYSFLFTSISSVLIQSSVK